MKEKGKLLIFSAPSGAGKTSIVKQLLKDFNNIGFSISATSRPTIREGERNGIDYYFMTKEEFQACIEQDDFVEWEEVYDGIFYGTLKSEIERIWRNGKHVIFDIDVVGGLNIKNQFPDRSLSFFIKPPSIDALKERLENRGSENKSTLSERVQKAEWEMQFEPEFDVVVENRDLEKAIKETEKHVKEFLQ